MPGPGWTWMEDNVPPRDHPLIGLDNIIITPHVAFFSQEPPWSWSNAPQRSRQRAPRPDARQPGKPGGAAAPTAEAPAASRLTYRRLLRGLMDVVIKNARVADGLEAPMVDIGIEDGRIAAIGPAWPVTH